METLFRREPTRPDRIWRLGMMAFHELICILVLTMILIWVTSLIMSWVSRVPETAATSDRWVSGIWLDGKRGLHIYRQREGIFRRDLATGNLERSVPFVPEEQTLIGMSHDCATILTCSPDGLAVIYENGDEANISQMPPDAEFVAAIVSEDGNLAACVTLDRQLYGWRRNGDDWSEFHHDFSPGSRLMNAAINPTGDRIMLAGTDGVVAIYDLNSGTAVGVSAQIGSSNSSVAWSQDERTIAVLSRNCVIRVFDASTGQLLREGALIEQMPYCDVSSLKFSPNGHYLAATMVGANEIFVWNIITGTLSGRLRGHQALSRAIQFSAGSDRLYSGSYDGTVREWSLTSFAQIHKYD